MRVALGLSLVITLACVVGSLVAEPVGRQVKAVPSAADETEKPDARPDRGKRPPIAIEAERPAGKPTLTSGLRVPPGETFHLGERQTGDFTVSARNRGRETVVLIATRGERRERVAVLKPDETAVARFKTGDGVLVQNPAERGRASLYVEVWGTRDLSMYYKPNTEEPPLPEDGPAAAPPDEPGQGGE